MTRLTRIQIEGFKSIREMDLELRPLNVLIGANGAGKSNFIEVFRLLNEIVYQNLQGYVAKKGGANRFLRFGEPITKVIELSFFFDEDKYVCKLAPNELDNLVLFEEGWGNFLAASDVESGIKESHIHMTHQIKEIIDLGTDNLLRILRGWQVYHFHDAGDTSPIKRTNQLNHYEVLDADGGNLAAFLYVMRETHPSHYQRIVKTIQIVAPFFDDFYLKPEPLNPDTIRLQWCEKGHKQPFYASYLSDGTLRFIALTTLLLQPNPPKTIIIDEPELGLHPTAIHILAGMLESVSAKQQIIVATQSVTLVNQLTPEDIVVVSRKDEQSVFRRVNHNELTAWLDEDYGMGDLWEKNVIGGRP